MRSRLATSWSFCVTLGCSRAWADARSCSGNSGRSWGSPMLRRKRVVVLVLPRVTRGISDMIAAGFHMTLWIRRGVVVLVLLAGVSVYALQQQGSGRGGRRGGADDEEDVLLPNGKSQKEEILKAEHQQNLKDAAELADLAEQLKMELEKNDRYILSMATLKKTDDIEKLAKRIRARLRHN